MVQAVSRHEIAQESKDEECSCKNGPCSEDDWSAGRTYQRVDDQCCGWEESAGNGSSGEKCRDSRRDYLKTVFAGKEPGSDDSPACLAELANLNKTMLEFARKADFDGHHINSVHAEHFASDLMYSLLTGGDDESHGLLYTTGGKPFSFWSGLPEKERTELKQIAKVVYLHPDLPLGPWQWQMLLPLHEGSSCIGWFARPRQEPCLRTKK